MPLTIEGGLVAKSTGTVSAFTLGDRVFHQRFGNGSITTIDGNQLAVQFDRAGEKRVDRSFCGAGVKAEMTTKRGSCSPFSSSS